MPTYDVIMKCQCPTCPVQTDSACAKPKITARNEMLQNPEKRQLFSPGMMRNVEMMMNRNPQTIRDMTKEQMQGMSDEMMKNTSKEEIESMAPKVENMPGPYCAYGVSVCKDLDFSKACICSGCQVFKDYSLNKAKPTLYYCKYGKPA